MVPVILAFGLGAAIGLKSVWLAIATLALGLLVQEVAIRHLYHYHLPHQSYGDPNKKDK